MNASGSDHPTDKKDHATKYPYIRPEDLKPSEHLAMDAEDVEDFIEHFAHHDEHHQAHNMRRAEKLASQAREVMEDREPAEES